MMTKKERQLVASAIPLGARIRVDSGRVTNVQAVRVVAGRLEYRIPTHQTVDPMCHEVFAAIDRQFGTTKWVAASCVDQI